MRAVCVAILAGLAAFAHARAASAGELELTWTAPPGCPTSSDLRDAILRSSNGESRERVEAVARVERTEPQRWSVTVQTTRAGVASAERRLEATSCRALADATAVILALALIPERAAADEPATPAAAEPTPPAPALAPVPEPAPIASPDRTNDRAPPRHTLAASASLATDASTLPSPAVGARGALAWTPGAARLELAGSYFSAQSQTTGVSSAGARFTSGVVGARASWTLLQSVIELSPRVGADVELLRASGFGAADNYDASAAWLSVAGGALVTVPVTHWLSLRADADGIVPLSRPRFVVDGEGAVHQPSTFGLRAAIGAELLFL